MGYVLDLFSFEYLFFGMMLGKDGKLFKICLGGIVKLKDLFDEVVECVDKFILECS